MSGAPPGQLDGPALLAAATTYFADYTEDLELLVGIDSGSYDAAGVDRIGRWAGERLVAQGFSVEQIASMPADGVAIGASVVGRRTGSDPDGATILLMAHMDTVFDQGDAAGRPYAVQGDIARGPGVCDDKAGLLAGLYAVRVLDDLRYSGYRELIVHCSPDEEIGSPASRAVIQSLAAGADAAICLEGARANGDIVSARKGIADLRIEVEGRAAHAGIEPEKGINAALEAAHLTVGLQSMNGRWPTVTVNVGVLSGGSRPNVVCAAAYLEVDLRASTTEQFAAAYAEVERLCASPTVPGAKVTLRATAEHVPWEKTAETAELVRIARRIGDSVGVVVQDAVTGGAADANTTAAMGVPTIDGLGPVGGDDHSTTEWLDLRSIPSRVALLAGLIAAIPKRGQQ